jgi:DNA-binding transcriptional ArsR family regulator
VDINDSRTLRGAGELTALAHPVRLGIIEMLSLHGPLTATDLADLLDESPANCSWHLRKLAEHGIVEEAPKGPGRRRPWQMSETGLRWNEAEATGEELQAGLALAEMTLRRSLERLRAALLRVAHDRPEWRTPGELTQTVAWLTADELAERNAAIAAVIQQDHERLEDPDLRPEGARLCEFVAWGVPVSFPGITDQEESR